MMKSFSHEISIELARIDHIFMLLRFFIQQKHSMMNYLRTIEPSRWSQANEIFIILWVYALVVASPLSSSSFCCFFVFWFIQFRILAIRLCWCSCLLYGFFLNQFDTLWEKLRFDFEMICFGCFVFVFHS